ncbi:hypothetical protein [Sorangium sp. So ce1099]|uniref:hypothetical protein n=1 Tax=Sorangium sp. So ce1099 TaxID=3133331 RepID=UPI003F5DBC8A
MKRRTNRAMRLAARGASALFFASMIAATHAMGCSDSGVDCDAVAELRASINDDNREAILEQIKEIDRGYQCEHVPPKECVPNKTSVTLNDRCGVFVSPAGRPGAEGTMSAPFASLQEAIERAQMAGTGVVYACVGQFDEAVVVNGSITVFGGLDCADGWKSEGEGKQTVLTASSGQVPLTMRPGNGTVHIEDLRILAAAGDPTVDGQSSIAAVADGGKVELARCELEAQDAADGFAGAALRPSSRDDKAPNGEPGNNGKLACSVAGNTTSTDPPVTHGCGTEDPSDESTGGQGGPGLASVDAPGDPGDPNRDLVPNGETHPNGGTLMAGVCSPDEEVAGADGTPGDDGQNAQGLGSISESGYTGISGTGGTKGTTAQGGGGGAGAKGGSACSSAGFTGTGGASGGNGGSGGCGGQEGKGGHFGGSSIALISLGATLVFEDVVLKVGNGGNGGDGEPGQLGGQGGDGGAGGLDVGALSPGCKGGRGGKGGDGGHGGGGLGGHSVDIAFLGKQPPNTGVAITHGQPGQGGTGPDDTTAADGTAAEALSFTSPTGP